MVEVGIGADVGDNNKMAKHKSKQTQNNPGVSDLLSLQNAGGAIASRLLEYYEGKTGLNGLKDVVHPLISAELKDRFGNKTLPDVVGSDLFNIGKFVVQKWIENKQAIETKQLEQQQQKQEQQERIQEQYRQEQQSRQQQQQTQSRPNGRVYGINDLW